jgi:hypothetical protein
MQEALAAAVMRGREPFHFKYHFNTTATQKLVIPSTNNQPVV